MKLFNIILGSAIVFFIVMFLRCDKVTEITELSKNTESMQIVFYNDSTPNKIKSSENLFQIKTHPYINAITMVRSFLY